MSAVNTQDWKPVVLRKDLTKQEMLDRGMGTVIKKAAGGTNKQGSSVPNAKTIENDDFYKPATTTADLAKQISSARNAKKDADGKSMTQDQLAKACNVHKSIITAYENPHSNAVVDANILQKISKVLGIPLKKPKRITS
jgi:ribosome-binding protein aMBF1 (putative translation factor)